MTKELVKENVTKQDDSRDAIQRRTLTNSCKLTAFAQLYPLQIGRGRSEEFPLQVERVRERVRLNNSGISQSQFNVKGLARASRGRALSSKMTKSLQTTSADPFNASEQEFAYSPIGLFTFINHFTHFTHLRKRFAFTLAETLITLGVIGIVAAMTIPNLVQSYQEKVTVTKVKKMYSTLSQAYALYKVDNDVDETYVNNHDGAVKVFDIFQKNLKVSKICSGDEGCISDKYSRQNHDSYGGYTSESYYSVRLEDGSALTFRGGSAETLFQIYYDVNGKLPPNKWGTDFFQFNGYKDKIIPCCGVKSDSNLKLTCYETGWGCTEWIVYNGNMDYLHCPDELSWDGKHKCSD